MAADAFSCNVDADLVGAATPLSLGVAVDDVTDPSRSGGDRNDPLPLGAGSPFSVMLW